MNVIRQFEVRVGPPSTVTAVESALEAAGSGTVTTKIHTSRRPPLLKVRLTGAMDAVARVMQAVEKFSGATIVQDLVESDDADGATYPDRNALLRMGSDPTATPKGVAPVMVAIVDTGMMVNHPALENNVWRGVVDGQTIHGYRHIGDWRNGYQHIDPTKKYDVTDDDGHGTQIAGTVLTGAQRASTVELMPLKFFDARTRPAAVNAARCIEFAAENDAHVIVLSFDVGIRDDALEKAIAKACAAGALVVIAAGNDGTNNDRFDSVPACYAEKNPGSAVVVMATNRYDEKAPFSNYGVTTVDLAAPGVRIMSTVPFLSSASAGYRRHSGTSDAAALVGGAAALLKSLRPDLTAPRLKKCLLASVDTFGDRLKCATGGRLNVEKLLGCP